MKNLLKLAVPTMVAVAATFTGQAYAIISPAQTFNFISASGYEGGSVTISSSTTTAGIFDYTISIDNLSTVGYGSATGAAITGVAFDFSPDFVVSSVVADSFSVTRVNGTDVTAGWELTTSSSGVSGSSESGTQLNTLSLDFIGDQTGNVNSYGIFNTDSPLDAVITFSSTQELSLSNPYTALLRMKRTGVDGEGSLKLLNTTVGVPEPSSLALLALGLAGVGFSRRMAGK